MAPFDTATGLLDKDSIQAYSIESLNNSVTDDKELSNDNDDAKKHHYNWMAMCDIDDLRDINEMYGQDLGDAIIKTVASNMKRCTEGIGKVGRFGGDEFFMMFNNITEEEIRDIFRNLKKNISEECKTLFIAAKKPEIDVTLSVGTVSSPLNGIDYDKLFAMADKALYIAKGKGKNRYIIYREDMHNKTVIPKGIENIKYSKDYSLRLAENINVCMDTLYHVGRNKFRDCFMRIMDTMGLNIAAMFEGDKITGIYNVSSDASIFHLSSNEKSSIIPYSEGMINEITGSSEAFATGLLKISYTEDVQYNMPEIYNWMTKMKLKNCIFYYPFSRGSNYPTPLFVFGYSNDDKWRKEDEYFLMIFCNIIENIIDREVNSVSEV